MRSDICVEKPLEAVSVSPAVDAVFSYFGKEIFHHEPAGTSMETLWLPQGKLLDVMRFLRRSEHGFDMLFDLHAVDERLRRHRPTGLGQVGFSVFYQLVSLRTGRDLMIKVEEMRLRLSYHLLQRSGLPQTGMNVKFTTCLVSCLRGIPALNGCSCRRDGRGIL